MRRYVTALLALLIFLGGFACAEESMEQEVMTILQEQNEAIVAQIAGYGEILDAYTQAQIQGDLTGSIEMMRSLLADLLNEIAEDYMGSDNLEEAQKCYEFGLEFDPDHAGLLSGYCGYLILSASFEEPWAYSALV